MGLLFSFYQGEGQQVVLAVGKFQGKLIPQPVCFLRYWNIYKTIRQINDRLCQEHKLSVIKKPKEKGNHYVESANEKRGLSWKAKLRRTIDRVLPAVSSYEEFLEAMRREGYEIQTTWNILSFSLSSEGRDVLP